MARLQKMNRLFCPLRTTSPPFSPADILATSVDVVAIPERVLASPELANYIMEEGDDGEEDGNIQARCAIGTAPSPSFCLARKQL